MGRALAWSGTITIPGLKSAYTPYENSTANSYAFSATVSNVSPSGATIRGTAKDGSDVAISPKHVLNYGSGTYGYNTICGLVRPSSGRVCVFGEEIGIGDRIPQDIGVIIEQPGFLPHYSGFYNLKLLASIRRIITENEVKAAMRLVGLVPESRKPVRSYSQGMRQRLGIAQAIMEHPRLLVLDEPTNGLDTEGVALFRRLIQNLRARRGTTILITSHYADDIVTLCDSVYHMEHGRLESLASSSTLSIS